MSGVKRTEDLHTVKTRSLLLQNSDNTFPPENSVLAVIDSRGHIETIRDLNVNSVAINNDAALLDGSGDILARSITLDSSGGIAIVTSGDMIINNGNIYNSGDQNDTGFIQTTYLTLLDLSANNPNTYLFANSGSLLWQNDNLSESFNLSQGIQSLSIDPTYPFRLLNPDGDPELYTTVNNLLKVFSNKQIFIDVSGSGPTPPIPVVSSLNAYNVVFNSKCGMIIRFINSDGSPRLDIGEFVFFGNPNSGSSQITISNLCVNLTNSVNTQGSLLSQYMEFKYNTNPNSPYSVTISLRNAGLNVVFLDIERVGEAKRFMNHLLLTNQKWKEATPTPSNFQFGPPFGQTLAIPPNRPQDYAQYLNYVISGSIIGYPFANLLKYPNNDTPLLSPTFTATLQGTRTIIINIVAPPNITGLTAPEPLQLGTGNTFQSYGIYLNGKAIWLQEVVYPVGPVTFPVEFNGTLNPSGFNFVSVTSIDVYNETTRPLPQRLVGA